MEITPFRIEEYMGKHEFSARYLLSSSDAESVTIGEILSLEAGAHDAFLKHWCGYTESPGAPWLREVLATIYKTIDARQLVVVSAAEEAIFLFYHALLTPGDHAIVESPCYESALTLPKSGVDVSVAGGFLSPTRCFVQASMLANSASRATAESRRYIVPRQYPRSGVCGGSLTHGTYAGPGNKANHSVSGLPMAPAARVA